MRRNVATATGDATADDDQRDDVVPAIPVRDKEAWSVEEVAGVLGFSVRQVWRLHSRDPHFPRARRPRLPGANRGRTVWVPDEIREWLKRQPTR